MIHRAMLGSFERFIGILIEHYAGEFPLWLAPVQAIVLPIADRHNAYAVSVRRACSRRGCGRMSTSATRRSGARCATPNCARSPYLLVVGDREAEADEVSVRRHRVGDEGTASVDACGRSPLRPL